MRFYFALFERNRLEYLFVDFLLILPVIWRIRFQRDPVIGLLSWILCEIRFQFCLFIILWINFTLFKQCLLLNSKIAWLFNFFTLSLCLQYALIWNGWVNFILSWVWNNRRILVCIGNFFQYFLRGLLLVSFLITALLGVTILMTGRSLRRSGIL